jgi:hypothetical protein
VPADALRAAGGTQHAAVAGEVSRGRNGVREGGGLLQSSAAGSSSVGVLALVVTTVCVMLAVWGYCDSTYCVAITLRCTRRQRIHDCDAAMAAAQPGGLQTMQTRTLVLSTPPPTNLHSSPFSLPRAPPHTSTPLAAAAGYGGPASCLHHPLACLLPQPVAHPLPHPVPCWTGPAGWAADMGPRDTADSTPSAAAPLLPGRAWPLVLVCWCNIHCC